MYLVAKNALYTLKNTYLANTYFKMKKNVKSKMNENIKINK